MSMPTVEDFLKGIMAVDGSLSEGILNEGILNEPVFGGRGLGAPNGVGASSFLPRITLRSFSVDVISSRRANSQSPAYDLIVLNCLHMS